MATVLMFVLVVAAIVYIWFRMRRSSGAASRPSPDEFEDLNEKFLKNTGRKEGTADLVRVFLPDDLTLLRSLLDAEGIETFVLESRMGALYPLSAIPGFADSTVTIYEADYEAARQVILDYLAADPRTGSSRPELLVPSPS